MTREQTEPVVMSVITQDPEVAERTAHMLFLWAQALCVRLQLLAWKDAEAPAPCVLFLDLQGEPVLPEELPPACALVILSDDPHQAIQAYQWHPAARLSPDFGYEDLCRAMDRCFRFWRQGLALIEVPCQWDRVRIPLSRIQYAESMGRDTILHCPEGPIRVNQSLSRLEPDLPAPPFLRCQKSFLVHPDAVDRVNGGELVMRDRQVISIARNRKQEVRELLARWRSDRGREP